MRNLYIILLLVIFTTAFSGESPPEAKKDNIPVNQNTTRFCIAFEGSLDKTQISYILNSFSARVIQKMDSFAFPVYIIEIDHRQNMDRFASEMTKKLENQPGVSYATTGFTDLSAQKVDFNLPKRQGSININHPANKNVRISSSGYGYIHYQEIVKNHFPGLEACISQRYGRLSARNYWVQIEIDIDWKGSVKMVRVLDGNIRQAGFLKCMSSKIKTWRDFPRRKTREDIILRFKFDY